MTSTETRQRVITVCEMIDRDIENAMIEAATWPSENSQAALLATLAAGVSGLAAAVKMLMEEE